MKMIDPADIEELEEAQEQTEIVKAECVKDQKSTTAGDGRTSKT